MDTFPLARKPIPSPAAAERTLRFADFPETFEASAEFQVRTAKGLAASPNAFSRTPLFGASEKKRTLLSADEEIVVIDDPDGYQVVLAGGLKSRIPGPYGLQDEVVSSRFDQTDYTVFLGLLQHVKGRLGANVVFEPYQFVKTLGQDDCEANVLTVFSSIARMAETRLAVRWPLGDHPGHFEYVVGRLVSSVGYNTKTAKYSIMLDPRMAALFRPAHFSSLEWQHRLALKGSLARWLHAELSSHENGRFRWTHKLQEAYGSKSTPALFKLRLKAAALEVERVTGWAVSFEKNGRNPQEKVIVTKPTHAAASDHGLPGGPAADSEDAADRPRYGFTAPASTQH